MDNENNITSMEGLDTIRLDTTRVVARLLVTTSAIPTTIQVDILSGPVASNYYGLAIVDEDRIEISGDLPLYIFAKTLYHELTHIFSTRFLTPLKHSAGIDVNGLTELMAEFAQYYGVYIHTTFSGIIRALFQPKKLGFRRETNKDEMATALLTRLSPFEAGCGLDQAFDYMYDPLYSTTEASDGKDQFDLEIKI